MVDEKDEQFEGHEESEYHFSDEQMNYEMEEGAAPEEQKPSGPKESSGKMGSNRRYIIGGVAFFVLIYVVYKIMSPSGTTAPGEITQAALPAKSVSTAAMHPQMSPQAMPSSTTQPTMSQAQMQAPPVTSAVQPSAGVGMPQAQPQVQQPPMVTANMPPGANNDAVDVKTVLDKLDALSQQNAKMAYALGTEYPQKFSSYEEQNAALQTKVQDLTNRIANLESSLNQLIQALQGGGNRLSEGPSTQMSAQAASPSPASLKQVEPKINYTVQAIIPGRAWLKSDSGDTITIAEGDVLRDLGRISKIDPYDGVVEVDTGTKVVSLTYGG